LNIWPGIVDFLIDKLHNENDSMILSAAKAICFIIEDSGRAFEEPKFEDELNKLLPSLSNLLMTQPAKNDEIRGTVIHTINMLIISSTKAIYDSTEDYLKILLEIIKEDSIILKKRAVQGLTNVLDFRIELAMKYYEPLFNVMLECLKFEDQQVSLAAAEFWSGLALNRMEDEEDDLKRIETIKQVLPVLGPILLES